MRLKQTTIRSSVSLTGTGIHSGREATVVMHPATADSGVRFICAGTSDVIRADRSAVVATELCTVIANETGRAVATVEHLMAAIYAAGVDNLLVEIFGEEVPILDGSALPFMEAIASAGAASVDRPRRYLRVERPVRVERGGAWAALAPCAGSAARFTLDVEIDFAHPAIGRQRRVLNLDADSFRVEIAAARTFGNLGDVERLRAAGFARGASLANAVVLDGAGVLNPGGLRHADEFVRHKILDVVGDLALAGSPILGDFRSVRGGHALNRGILDALFDDPANYSLGTLAELGLGKPEMDDAAVAREAASVGMAHG